MAYQTKVSDTGSGQISRRKNGSFWRRRRWYIIIVAVIVVSASAISWKVLSAPPSVAEPPEAAKVLAAQQNLQDFGILIPGYLPGGFNRSGVDVQVNQTGPSGEPSVDMLYRNKNGSYLSLHQWVPVNADLETLNGSRIIQTKWGKSWLLTEGTDGLVAVWVDIGPLRVSISSPDQKTISRQQLVLAAETLTLASNAQAFSFVTQLPQIVDMAPPPPFNVQTNAGGVQELNLTITPGGYSPIRFAVNKGVPVKINFSAVGDVGCGSVLIFPTGSGSNSALTLSKQHPTQTVEFTPQVAGDFQFTCGSNHYRGIMSVRDAQ
jgi:hypothetical protein